eukprot:5899900-Prymnesium_polylepis.1
MVVAVVVWVVAMAPPPVARRAVVGVSTALLAALTSGPPRCADGAGLPLYFAALPEGSRIRESVELSLRPKVRALPRRQIEVDFAVMLMRT